ncbi:hypothetical protein K439DRAFT_1383226 [Ramaria rubella]|nr:hypothetical protein K439DRAFT_1383226 [Ramaria rubella]
MSSFAFVPRSVGKGTKRNITSKADIPPRRLHSLNKPPTSPTVVQTEQDKLKDDELLVLIEMSLSDYSFWCHPKLQRAMLKQKQDGYFPVKYLLKQSTFLSTLPRLLSEADIMRCIRASPESSLETRMLISEPSRSEWFNRGPNATTSYQSQNGGFEVRRKDWETLLQTFVGGVWNKEWWDCRTVYIERLPAAYRTLCAIAPYVKSLLPKDRSSSMMLQSVTFPPHHLASPDEPPRCKGFAFIILNSPELVDALCQFYPWDGPSSDYNLEQEAVKFGVRALPKRKWDSLKAEYLAHRQRLLSQVAENETGPEVSVETSFLKPDIKKAPSPQLQVEEMSQDQSSNWYPHNCLIFVRNIHHETNKTTLRALFSAPLSSKGAVDYVDFNKGIDTCYLRLAAPTYATQLISHFAVTSVAQQDALDQTGSVVTQERPGIELELVKGKREELYWDKVPEKVRNAALAHLQDTKDPQNHAEKDANQRRKRRKKV